jgi:hypothetical protein
MVIRNFLNLLVPVPAGFYSRAQFLSVIISVLEIRLEIVG